MADQSPRLKAVLATMALVLYAIILLNEPGAWPSNAHMRAVAVTPQANWVYPPYTDIRPQDAMHDTGG